MVGEGLWSRQGEGPGIIAAVLCLAAVTLLPACSRVEQVSAAAPSGKTPAKPLYHRPYGAYLAPNFPPGLTWFNVRKPLDIHALRGKMVLLDFWTYG